MCLFTQARGTDVTGHTFALQTNNCTLFVTAACRTGSHSRPRPATASTYAVSLLNQWATNNGPALFGVSHYTNYLQNAWEYTSPGSLAAITNTGPSSADQLLIPNAIKQARFDLYMVNNDGSYGVHNPGYVPFLIADATNKVGRPDQSSLFRGHSGQRLCAADGLLRHLWHRHYRI